ncbi:SPX-containing protein [Coleophoma crateriformis]|uniref:SPX-containing protein n=1 Tax=Coleophoma crateriformis TaxID=565419 RepID=A0A3D8SYI1_9HELO|nr:SPX-containing protein [Coleophoma crateriformis]
MKYGETFQRQSAPQWAPYNVDYNELKNLIKVNTTKNQGQAVAIPGQADTALGKFEAAFFTELAQQHDRVDLFVKSKADEISRRLEHLHKSVVRSLARLTYTNGKPVSQRRRDKFAKYNGLITRCGDDLRDLDRFVEAQRVAFHKILKKYKKWTGSPALSNRFRDEVLGDPKSFTRRDFSPIMAQYNALLDTIRTATPSASEPSSPRAPSSLREPQRSRVVIPVQQAAPQAYWNEYDDGSEAGDEPYTIAIDPEAESTFPGARTMAFVYEKAKVPMEKVKGWLSPKLDSEREPLLTGTEYFPRQRNASMTDTDIEDEAYASSSDFPAGYVAHYATFPSISDQKFAQHREQLLMRGTVCSFIAAFLLMAIAGILVMTGRHRLRMEVDAGAVVGVVASLFFGALGVGMMLYRKQKLVWLHRTIVGLAFVTVCVLNGMLLVLIVSL